MKRPQAVLISVPAMVGLVLGLLAVTSGPQPLAPSPRARAAAPPSVAGLPLRFEVNQGQTDASVRFIARGGGTVFIRPTEAVLALPLPAADNETQSQRIAVAMKLLGADPAAEVSGLQPLDARTNYLHGKDPARWITGVPTYGRVLCREVYPGIDLSYRGSDGHLEYDFIVAPGSDPAQIRLAFDGVDASGLDSRCDLVLEVAGRRVVHRAPVLYQEVGEDRQPVAGRFISFGDHTFGFEVEDYDPDLPLVVDPVIAYATYLGGSGDDILYGIAVDDGGDTYVAGYSESSDFPGLPGIPPSGGQVAVVARIAPGGTALSWVTYLGGSSYDRASDVEVDAAGIVYVSGITYSSDFPTTPGAYDRNFAGASDVFAAVLNPAGDTLLYSTLLGGSDFEYPEALALGPPVPPGTLPRMYLAGYTQSPDMPATPGAFDPSHNGARDAFFAVIDASAPEPESDLKYFTYLGSGHPSGRDEARDIEVDGDGYAYILGESVNSRAYSQFPTTPDAWHPTLKIKGNGGQTAVFLTKISPDGAGPADLLYSTFFLDPDEWDQAWGLGIDGNGRAVVTGMTFSTTWPTTPGAYDTTHNGHADAYVTVVDTTLSGEAGLVYSTFLGSSEQDMGRDALLDAQGNVYVIGDTTLDFPGSTDPVPFPTTPDAFAFSPAGFDIFLTKFATTGNGTSDLLFSTLIGGEDDEGPHDLVLANGDQLYFCGSTVSLGFPTTPGALDPVGDPVREGFVVHVSMTAGPTPPDAPSNLTATAASSSQIDLAWIDNASDEDGFEIERSPDGSNWSPLTTLGPDATSHQDTGLAANTTWHYRVLASNANGSSPWSNVATATTLPSAPPAAPSNLNATVVSSSQIDLAWTDNATEESHFEIERSPANAGSWTLIATPSADTTTWSDTTVSPNTAYDYQVRAVNLLGPSAWSNVATATTPPLQTTDVTADADLPVQGTVTGSYLDTHASDDVYEAITERESGGKPSSRYSYLEHKWTFTVPTGATSLTFKVEAHHTANLETDEFVFAWSSDDSGYTNMLTVTKTSDDDTLQTFTLPAGLSGTVYIRVTDTDQDQGNNALDTLFVDHMLIEVQ